MTLQSEPLRSPGLEGLAPDLAGPAVPGLEGPGSCWVLRLGAHLGVLLSLGGAIFHRKQLEAGKALPSWISFPQLEGEEV